MNLSFDYFIECTQSQTHTHTHAHTHWQMSRVTAAVIINCKFDKQLQQQQQATAGSSCKSDNMLHGQRLCMTKANSENCYWKVQFFLSHRAVNYACIVLIHRLNRAHTNTHTLHTHTNTHIVLVCCVSACVPKKRSQTWSLSFVYWFVAVVIRSISHTHTYTHTTSATHTLASTPHTQ